MRRLKFGPVLLSCLLLSPIVLAKEPVRICYESNPLPPYALGQDSVPAQHPGAFIEMISLAIRNAGLKPEFYRSSWKRCVADLRASRTDTLFAMIWTKERDNWAQFPKDEAGNLRHSAHLWQGDYRIFVPQNSSLSWDGEQLQNLSFGVGAPFGYLAYQQLEALDALAIFTVDAKGGFELTARGRMDGYVVDQAIGSALIRELELEQQLTSLPVPFLQEPWYLPFSHRFYQADPNRAERIWHELSQVREQQGLQLIKRYLNNS